MSHTRNGRRIDRPVFLHLQAHRTLIDLAAQMTLFLGEGLTVSPSAAARYAVMLLADEAALFKDMGQADVTYTKKRMLDAIRGYAKEGEYGKA